MPTRVTPRRPSPDDGKPGDAPDGQDDKTSARGEGAHQPEKQPETPPTPRWKKLLYWAIGLSILAALVIAGVLYWLHARHYESTDDAFIDGHISQVSPQVAARVLRLGVEDNQDVRQGEVLVELDPRDFQVKLDQARAQRAQAMAQLGQARAGLQTQQASLDQAAANVRVSEADLGQAQADLARYRSIDPKAITRQQLDTAGATTKAAQARLDASRQAVAAARANIESQRSQIEAAEAAVAQADVTLANAQLQLSYTTIEAPRAGRVARRTVEVGNYVNPGQSLLAIVGPDRWVTANFKETQLADMKVGQYVRLSVDACPDRDYNGRIDSFQPGSGNIFSSLPAENATGNYVKVVQRIPVKIVFDDARVGQCLISPGMSVQPRVTVR